MNPIINDKVTLRSQYPRDELLVDLGSNVEVRVGKITAIDGQTVSIEYPPKTVDESRHGAIHKCDQSDLVAAGDNCWELNLQVTIENA